MSENGRYTEIAGGKITETYTKDFEFFAGGSIISTAGKSINETGEEKGLSFKDPKDPPKIESKDFDIKLSLNKDNDTLVPLGVADFAKKEENQFIKFKVTITGKGVNKWELDIKNKDEIIYTLYSATDELKEVVVTGKSKKGKKTTSEEKPKADEINRFWPAGEYELIWDGFDKKGIYNSAVLLENNLTASIKGFAEFKEKTSETVKLEFDRKEVSWVDVKINKKTKRIDVTLRVNLTDGGAVGLNCNTYATESETSYETFTPTTNQPDPFKDTKVTICDWDKIPASKIKPNQPIIKTRTRSFADLVKLAKDGFEYHWGRNKNHSEAKNVIINGLAFESFVNLSNTTEKTLGKLELIFNTNNEWLRSGNPGTVKDPMTFVGNIVSREAICYNVGYIYEYFYKNNWDFQDEKAEDLEFQFTSAHEIGHEILKKYGGTFYSYGHKGTVNSVTQNMKDSAPKYPKKGEIDIMPYYPSSPPPSLYNRYVADKTDVLSLIWLTKIEIK